MDADDLPACPSVELIDSSFPRGEIRLPLYSGSRQRHFLLHTQEAGRDIE